MDTILSSTIVNRLTLSNHITTQKTILERKCIGNECWVIKKVEIESVGYWIVNISEWSSDNSYRITIGIERTTISDGGIFAIGLACRREGVGEDKWVEVDDISREWRNRNIIKVIRISSEKE